MKYSKTFMASIVALAIFSIAAAPMATSAFADPHFTPGKENWGGATSWYAQNYDQGEHASDPNGSGDSNDDGFDRDPGRTGLGNLYQYFEGDWCALLDFLDDIDDDAVLTCEEQAEG